LKKYFDAVPEIQVPSMDKEKIDLERTLGQIEKKMLSNALVQADGIINKAAKQLNLSFRSMRYLIQKHQLKGKSKDNE